MPVCVKCGGFFRWGSDETGYYKEDPRTGFIHDCDKQPVLEECYDRSAYQDCVNRQIVDCSILPKPPEKSYAGGAFYVCERYIPKQRTLDHFR